MSQFFCRLIIYKQVASNRIIIKNYAETCVNNAANCTTSRKSVILLINRLSYFRRLDDGQGNDDQYDGGDYDKEPQQKNDIHLGEGEDEGEGNLMRRSNNLVRRLESRS